MSASRSSSSVERGKCGAASSFGASSARGRPATRLPRTLRVPGAELQPVRGGGQEGEGKRRVEKQWQQAPIRGCRSEVEVEGGGEVGCGCSAARFEMD